MENISNMWFTKPVALKVTTADSVCQLIDSTDEDG